MNLRLMMFTLGLDQGLNLRLSKGVRESALKAQKDGSGRQHENQVAALHTAGDHVLP